MIKKKKIIKIGFLSFYYLLFVNSFGLLSENFSIFPNWDLLINYTGISLKDLSIFYNFRLSILTLLHIVSLITQIISIIIGILIIVEVSKLYSSFKE